jgi:hypothetical protein
MNYLKNSQKLKSYQTRGGNKEEVCNIYTGITRDLRKICLQFSCSFDRYFYPNMLNIEIKIPIKITKELLTTFTQIPSYSGIQNNSYFASSILKNSSSETILTPSF